MPQIKILGTHHLAATSIVEGSRSSVKFSLASIYTHSYPREISSLFKKMMFSCGRFCLKACCYQLRAEETKCKGILSTIPSLIPSLLSSLLGNSFFLLTQRKSVNQVYSKL